MSSPKSPPISLSSHLLTPLLPRATLEGPWSARSMAPGCRRVWSAGVTAVPSPTGLASTPASPTTWTGSTSTSPRSPEPVPQASTQPPPAPDHCFLPRCLPFPPPLPAPLNSPSQPLLSPGSGWWALPLIKVCEEHMWLWLRVQLWPSLRGREGSRGSHCVSLWGPLAMSTGHCCGDTPSPAPDAWGCVSLGSGHVYSGHIKQHGTFKR